MADDKVLPNLKDALVKDGWQVKPKALLLRDTGYQFLIDVDAEKDGKRVAIEVKSWLSESFNQDWYMAFGQYLTYQGALHVEAPEYELYLAVPEDIYYKHFNTFILSLVKANSVKIVIFDTNTNTVAAWKR